MTIKKNSKCSFEIFMFQKKNLSETLYLFLTVNYKNDIFAKFLTPK